MIGTTREYAAARRQVKELEAALLDLGANRGSSHPDVERALAEAYKGELARVRDEMERFDAVRSGQTRTLTISSLEALGEAVVLARTAAGKTQQQLAKDLGVTPQQIQRDEATRYARAGIDRLHAVMQALGINFEGKLALADAAQDGPQLKAGAAHPTSRQERRIEPERLLASGQ